MQTKWTCVVSLIRTLLYLQIQNNVTASLMPLAKVFAMRCKIWVFIVPLEQYRGLHPWSTSRKMFIFIVCSNTFYNCPKLTNEIILSYSLCLILHWVCAWQHSPPSWPWSPCPSTPSSMWGAGPRVRPPTLPTSTSSSVWCSPGYRLLWACCWGGGSLAKPSYLLGWGWLL